MRTLPRNSAGQTLFLFFASFRRSKSPLCHLLCEATCSRRTDKRLGSNVTSVDEYSKIVTAHKLGDRIVRIWHIFCGMMHISRLIYNSWIEKTYSNASQMAVTVALCHSSKVVKSFPLLGLVLTHLNITRNAAKYPAHRYIVLFVPVTLKSRNWGRYLSPDFW